MANHIETCIAAVEAAGWTGKAAQRLIVDPRSETPEGFQALLKEANEVRAVICFAERQIRNCDQDTEGAADYFVAQGYSLERVRCDTLNLFAEYDEAHSIDTTPCLSKVTSDPYQARAAEIDQHKKGQARG